MKKSVTLFNSPIMKEKTDVFEMGNLFPRIGIASIAAVLLKNNIKTIVIDPQVMSLEDVKNKIKGFNPDIVGIPAYTSEIHDAADTARCVKEIINDVLTVVGGPHCSAIPVETLKEFDSFDIATVGEGEFIMLDLASGKKLEKIDGIVYRNNGKIIQNKPRKLISDLDSLPMPAWHLYDMKKYRGGGLSSGFGKKDESLEIPVEGARGCPFNCIFCYRVTGRNIRFKSAKKIVDEVERNVNEYGATKIFFIEGTFAVNRKIAMEMLEELIRRGIHQKITWSTGTRSDITNRELLLKMKESGCNFIGYGVESGCQEILDKIKKGITLDQITKSFEMSKEVGIKTEANFIIGHPFETEESVLKTIEFAKNLNADYANFAILVPFPGTKIVEMARKKSGGLKILSKDWRVYGKQIGAALELEQLPHEKLVKLQTLAYIKFYLTPKRFPRFIERMSLKRVAHSLRRILAIR